MSVDKLHARKHILNNQQHKDSSGNLGQHHVCEKGCHSHSTWVARQPASIGGPAATGDREKNESREHRDQETQLWLSLAVCPLTSKTQENPLKNR